MAQTRISEQPDSNKMDAKAAAVKMKPSYKHIPHSQKPPHLVAKRNARERRRVQAVNQAFYKLRKSVPIENRNKRVSKVKTLQRAIDYIRKLEMILAQDEASSEGGAVMSNVASSQPQQGPLQQSKSQVINSSSGTQDDKQPACRGNNKHSAALAASGELFEENDAKETRAKGRPKKFEFELSEAAAARKLQRPPVPIGQKLQRRGRKPSGNKLLTGDLQQNNQPDGGGQQGRRTSCSRNSLGAPHDDDQHAALKSAGGDGLAGAGLATGSMTTSTNGLYLPANGAGVPYGRPRDATTSHHYANHQYHYYVDSPTNTDQDQFHHQIAYIPHLQFPLEGQQRQPRARPNGENGFCDYQAANHYHPADADNCFLPPDSASQYRSGINHEPFSSHDTIQPLACSQSGARSATGAWHSERHQQQPATGALLESDKATSKSRRPHFAESAGAHSMPADSTSSSSSSRMQLSGGPQKSALNSIGSPISICSSSSSLSPSTTLKSLDLSGGSSTSSAMFSVANSNGSDKSPSTTTPLVCRQHNNNLGRDSGAHSTTVGGYHEQQPARHQQQVNNYADQVYAAHFSYEAHSLQPSRDYQRAPPARAIKPIGGTVQGKSQAASFSSVASAADVNYQNGSRSSSALSPLQNQQQQQQQHQLPLVGGNYLANNNLHGNNQQTVQSFQQQHFGQQLHQQQLNQEQPLYQQGQHFFGNQHGLQQAHHHHPQQLGLDHSSDHRNHHLQPDSAAEARRPSANTLELITTTNITMDGRSSLSAAEQLVANGSAPSQYTVLPL